MFVLGIRVYPVKDTITVKVKIYTYDTWSGNVKIYSSALSGSKESDKKWTKKVTVSAGVTEVIWEQLPLDKNSKRWDLDEGNLYELTVSLENGEEKTVTFGVRDFGDDGTGRLAINGRFFFEGKQTAGYFQRQDMHRWM